MFNSPQVVFRTENGQQITSPLNSWQVLVFDSHYGSLARSVASPTRQFLSNHQDRAREHLGVILSHWLKGFTSLSVLAA